MLLSLMIAISCTAQISQKQTADKIRMTAGTSKLIRSRDSGPYAVVHAILQDKKGNLWFGTSYDGVYRYDGRSFTNFTKKDGLVSNTVASLLEDNEGNIWCGCDQGISRYDGKNFTSLSVGADNSGLLFPNTAQNDDTRTKNTPSCMLKDRSGKIWIGTSKGVYCYDGRSFVHFLENDDVINKDHLKLQYVQSMLQDRNGNIWFTSWFDGLCRYDGRTITSFKPNGEVWFAGLLEDKQGNLWIGRRGRGVVRYDGRTFTNVLQHGIFDSCCVTSIVQDNAGNIWFGTEANDLTERETEGGAWRYDGKVFSNFTTRNGLPHCAVFSILKEKNGNLWFGTRNTGLCRYDGNRFTIFSE
jgi:ligand-binding sensor domain-containing protein